MEPEESSEALTQQILASMSVDDLRFLCDMFWLKRGGSKGELIVRLLDSEYSAQEIMGPGAELAIGILVKEFVPKSDWIDILRAHELPSGGSRHDLLLRLVENRLFDPRATLEALKTTQLREIYHHLFDRVPTGENSAAIAEILDAFNIPDKENETSQEGRSEGEAVP